MSRLTFKSNYPGFWLLNSSGWLLLWLIYMTLFYREYMSDPIAWLGLFITYFSGFLTSILLRFVYYQRRFQTTSITFISILIVMGSLLASQIWYWLDILLSIPLHGIQAMLDRITIQNYLSNSFSKSFTMLTWSAIYFVAKFWIEWNAQKERTEKATLLANSAQLQMLRYQLNPHFLFNALNSIRALIEEDKKKARDMITELSEFLRYSLISRNHSNVPLSHELEAIRHYLAIEKKRYEEKLEINYQIDPMAEDYPVLSFLIHPLVENAIKYGMQTSSMPLHIEIKARVQEDSLLIEVSNTGKWLEKEASREYGTGTGLENVRRRLENAFPNQHQMEIGQQNGKVRVSIRIKTSINHNEKIIPGPHR